MMSRLKRMINSFPTHHLLIIIFFVLEGNNEFFPDVPLGSSLKLFGFFFLIAAISFIICKALFKDIQRASAASLLFTYIVLYARTMYHYYALPWPDGLRVSNTHFFIVLGLITVLCVLAIRKTSLPALLKFNRFLTILFMTLILYNSVAIIYKSLRPEKQLHVSLNVPVLNDPIGAKPNIYLLLFDEYQGNDGLEFLYGNSSAGPDALLQKKGFHTIKHPRSNYNYTFYSLPSLLNMSYLDFSDGKLDYDLRRVVKSVRTMGAESPMLRYLKQQQYHIANHSFFDVAGIASPHRRLVVPHDGYSAIFSRTLPGWLQEDLLHFIPSNSIQAIVPTYFYEVHRYNEEVIQAVSETVKNKTDNPSFVYAHLLLPHPPLVTDKNGKLKNISAAMYEVNRQLPSLKSSYEESLVYANKVLEKLITEIQTSDPAAVIIFASDHGLRVYPDQQAFVFNTQCAVYIPGNRYEGFYDNVSMVNVMRLVLNNALGLKIPLAPDSTRLAK